MMLNEALTELTSLRAEAEAELNGSDVAPQDAARMNALDTAVRLAKDAPTVGWLKERLAGEFAQTMEQAPPGSWKEARARGFHLALARLQRRELAA